MGIYKENNEAIPAIILSETPVTGFTDITNDIENLDKYALKVYQWMHVRRKIKAAVIAIVNPDYSAWGLLTEAQKEIACKWILAPYALRLTKFSDAEDLENWKVLVRNNQGWTFHSDVKGRAFIVERMREHTSNELRIESWAYADSNDFLNSVIDYMMTYIFGEDQRLIQWINNEVGSPFENDGFAQKTYYDSVLRDELIDIYNGYY